MRSPRTPRPATTATSIVDAKPPDAQDVAHTPTKVAHDNIGDELALRAGLDPAWDAVLRVWIDGHDRWPQPFVNR